MASLQKSTPTTPVLGKGVDGPAPKAIPEDTSDDTMALNPGEQAVQFVPGQDPNGDARVEIGESGPPKFVGLGKEELMKYANDPFWVRLRWILFALFWLLWLAMLAGAIVIIVFAPKCADKLEGPTDGPYYQVQLDKFGNGKFSDLESDLTYLESLSVKSVVISQSLKVANGGVVDFQDLDEKAGTMEEFKKMLNALKAKGIKVFLQFIPNHSGLTHPWFTDANKKDYYVRVLKETPSKWASQLNSSVEGSAWSDDPAFSDSKYLHQFGVGEPDLNYKKPEVIKEMNEALAFWYSEGVDGFLLSEVSYLVEDTSKLDDSKYMKNQGNADVTKKFLDTTVGNWSRVEEREAPMSLLDVQDLATDKSIGYHNSHISVVSTALADLDANFTATKLEEIISSTLSKVGKYAVHWRTGSPRLPRPASKFGVQKAAVLALIAASSRGQYVHYYGDEFGIVNADSADPADPRLKSVEPFKKESTGEGLTLNQFYKDLFASVNKFNQKANGGGSTEYKTDGDMFGMKRENEGNTFVVVANVGSGEGELDVSGLIGVGPAEVLVSTPNARTEFEIGRNITSGVVKLPGVSATVLMVPK